MQRIYTPETEPAFRPQDSAEVFMLDHVARYHVEFSDDQPTIQPAIQAKTTALVANVVSHNLNPTDVEFTGEEAAHLILGLERIITFGRDQYRIAAAKMMLETYSTDELASYRNRTAADIGELMGNSGTLAKVIPLFPDSSTPRRSAKLVHHTRSRFM